MAVFCHYGHTVSMGEIYPLNFGTIVVNCYSCHVLTKCSTCPVFVYMHSNDNRLVRDNFDIMAGNVDLRIGRA